MNGTRTHTTGGLEDPIAPTDPKQGVKRKLPDNSNPLLAAATKRMKKEVGLFHRLRGILIIKDATDKLGRVQTETWADFLGFKSSTNVRIQSSEKSSQGVSSSFAHPHSAPYHLLILPHRNPCQRQLPTLLPDPRFPIPIHNHNPRPPVLSHLDRRNIRQRSSKRIPLVLRQVSNRAMCSPPHARNRSWTKIYVKWSLRQIIYAVDRAQRKQSIHHFTSLLPRPPLLSDTHQTPYSHSPKAKPHKSSATN